MKEYGEEGLTISEMKMRDQANKKIQEYFDNLQIVKKIISKLNTNDFLNIFQNEMDKRFRDKKIN